ncbi:hypothetical protein [Citrobacter portucalensis]|uniref:Uncharacterized protein n=1 Tax=Citrobacter portucalensis TaxID=1639133 RepID=A0A9Q9T1C1_9ENTR|nr:hypothetical protein [Citrobacter portucalensis]UYA94815.1 hypothetical protein KKU99_p00490 [Citrobacter portucalensis]
MAVLFLVKFRKTSQPIQHSNYGRSYSLACNVDQKKLKEFLMGSLPKLFFPGLKKQLEARDLFSVESCPTFENAGR